jgi:hypothetical protein
VQGPVQGGEQAGEGEQGVQWDSPQRLVLCGQRLRTECRDPQVHRQYHARRNRQTLKGMLSYFKELL